MSRKISKPDLASRLNGLLKIDDLREFKKASWRELFLCWKAQHPDRPKKNPGPRPPEVEHVTEKILSPLWEELTPPYDELLWLPMDALDKLKPGDMISGDGGLIIITSHALTAAKSWRRMRFIVPVKAQCDIGVGDDPLVVKVQRDIGDNPARAKRLRQLQERRAKLQLRLAQNPQNSALVNQICEIEGMIKKVDDIGLHYHEGTLRKPVRGAALRFLMRVGALFQEMPPCLVDKRQTWLGKGNRVNAFHARREASLREKSTLSPAEFEARFATIRPLYVTK
jgi:hypothetical protein